MLSEKSREEIQKIVDHISLWNSSRKESCRCFERGSRRMIWVAGSCDCGWDFDCSGNHPQELVECHDCLDGRKVRNVSPPQPWEFLMFELAKETQMF